MLGPSYELDSDKRRQTVNCHEEGYSLPVTESVSAASPESSFDDDAGLTGWRLRKATGFEAFDVSLSEPSESSSGSSSLSASPSETDRKSNIPAVVTTLLEIWKA